MDIKEFINNFGYQKPDWFQTPEGFPNCDLGGLTSAEVGKFNAIKGLWELSRPALRQAQGKLWQGSRVWQDPKGYEYLGVWQNAALLRVMIRVLTKGMVKGSAYAKASADKEGKWEYRRKVQMDDAARSTVRNIEEGWKRATTREYLDFLSYSQASLEEVNGDIRDCRTDGLLPSRPGSSLLDIGINLRVAKGPGKGTLKGEDKGLVKGEGKGQYKGGVWGDPSEPGHPYYQPLSTLTPNTLTYEMFVELINKTDWLLRKLVESLERKLADERKGYQIGQARIRDKFTPLEK